MIVLEALGAAVLAAPLVYLIVRLWRRGARWQPFYRSTEASTVQVGIERAGAADIEMADLDPHAEDFSQQLAAARAEAADRAAALNAALRN